MELVEKMMKNSKTAGSTDKRKKKQLNSGCFPTGFENITGKLLGGAVDL